MPINKSELTKDQIEKAMQCETAEELMRMPKRKTLTLPRKKPKRILPNCRSLS